MKFKSPSEFFLVLLVGALSACGPSHDKNSDGALNLSQSNLEPTFTSIRKNVFEAKCTACHVGGGAAEKVPLTDYAALLASPRELVLPGNPAESAIILSIEATGDSQMPPLSSGSGHLSDFEISTIRSWIQDGAKDN